MTKRIWHSGFHTQIFLIEYKLANSKCSYELH